MREYPYKIYASVLLLDNKIENWKVCFNPKYSIMEWTLKDWVKFNRLDEYDTDVKEFEVLNDKQHAEVFEELAPEWFKQWKHADDYYLYKAY